MKNRTTTKWIVLATVFAVLGFAGSASAGEVAAAMYEYPGGNTYSTCDWQPVYAKTNIYHYSGYTMCSVSTYSSSNWATANCNTVGAKGVHTMLRTQSDVLCSEMTLMPEEGAMYNAMCGGDYNLRRNSEWASCPLYPLAARGYGVRDVE